MTAPVVTVTLPRFNAPQGLRRISTCVGDSGFLFRHLVSMPLRALDVFPPDKESDAAWKQFRQQRFNAPQGLRRISTGMAWGAS